MRKLYTMLDKWSPCFLSLLRIVAGLLFICHGTQKILDYPSIEGGELPDLNSMEGIAGLIELVFGGLFILGLLTRPTAVIISGEMAAVYLMKYAKRGLWPIHNRGESTVLFCFIFLFFIMAGPGPFSLDRLIAKKLVKKTA